MMMTTRLTIEVSGIAYHDIDAFCAHLAKAGLSVGGTGSKVRPVVSCKATTCQYGLYDAYALSDEIHTRFYQAIVGYPCRISSKSQQAAVPITASSRP